MTPERRAELNKTGKGLTLKEWVSGFHFCHEWDGLLVGPEDPENESCTCFDNDE